MLGARKACSVLTGFALLFQTLFLPLPGHAQTSKKSLVRVCVPLDLVKNEFWGYPYPGSEMDLFMRLVGSYIHDHGDSRLQYRIKDQAFEIFKQARRASAPYTGRSA